MRRAPVIALALAAAALLVVACSGGSGSHSSQPDSAPTTVPVPMSGCPAGVVPAGFTLDSAHSGPLAAAEYSEDGDMQAAMIYDQYQGGYRTVYTDLKPTAPAVAQVVECVALVFGSPANATRFVAAYTALRQEAGSVAREVTPSATIGSTTLQYQETDQGFVGYGITSTNVVEMAAVDGDHFDAVSVAGPTPPVSLAVSLLKGEVTGA
jgi:hypothetical protein